MKKIIGNQILQGQFLHFTHCYIFLGWICLCLYIYFKYTDTNNHFDNIETYGYFLTILFFVSRFTILALTLFNMTTLFIGLIRYNSFNDKIAPMFSPIFAPFICFRVVTRGIYAKLVMRNVQKNKTCCINAGLTNFIIQVVTDIEIPLPSDDKYIMQTVVPDNYTPKNGVKFKGRALEYALEDSVNTFSDDDWIVHLDEESLLTRNSINGIINFISESKYDIGAGLICYHREKGANVIANQMDNYRIAEDMGRLRFQLRLVHRLLSFWHGSFIVTRVKTEKAVSFDWGSAAYLTEDLFFGMKAASEGYSFDFIDGEIWESSPFTLMDVLIQRKRWYNGAERVARSSQIPFLSKLLFVLDIYVGTYAVVFFSFANDLILPLAWNLRVYYEVPFIITLAILFYTHFYGLIKSYRLSKKFKVLTLLIYILLTPVVVIANLCLPFVVIWWCLLSKERTFNIIKKETNEILQV